jgi:hypothetical protein
MVWKDVVTLLLTRFRGQTSCPRHFSGSFPSRYLCLSHELLLMVESKKDPVEAHRRRGAAFTFDAQGFVDFVTELRHAKSSSDDDDSDGKSSSVLKLAPTFAHELKDPCPNAVRILETHRIVVFEGLYVLLSVEPWKRAAELMDERWFVEVARDDARQRLVRRHVLTGVTEDEQSAIFRGSYIQVAQELESFLVRLMWLSSILQRTTMTFRMVTTYYPTSSNQLAASSYRQTNRCHRTKRRLAFRFIHTANLILHNHICFIVGLSVMQLHIRPPCCFLQPSFCVLPL